MASATRPAGPPRQIRPFDGGVGLHGHAPIVAHAVTVFPAAHAVLGAVLFASALFFAGLSTKLESDGTRTGVLVLGCVLCVASFVYLATPPIQLA